MNTPMTAVLLSALVAPGVGQFRQKRPIIGMLFFLLFLAGIVYFCLLLFPSLVGNIRYILHPDINEPVSVPFGRLVLTLGALILIYAINVLDAWLSSRSPKA